MIVENLVGQSKIVLDGKTFYAQVKIPYAKLEDGVLELYDNRNLGQKEWYSITINEKICENGISVF
jgi:hypothetical protein